MTSFNLDEGYSDAASTSAYTMSPPLDAEPSQLRLAYDFLQKEHVSLLRDKERADADKRALQAEVERLRDDVRTQGEELHRVGAEAASTRRVLVRKADGYAALLKEEVREMERLKIENDMLVAERQALEDALQASNQEIASLKADAERRVARGHWEWRSRMLQRCNELVPLVESRLAELKSTQASLSNLDSIDADQAAEDAEERDHGFLLQLLTPHPSTKTQRNAPTHPASSLAPPFSDDQTRPSAYSTPQPGILRGDILTLGLPTPKPTPDDTPVSLTSHSGAHTQPSTPSAISEPRSSPEPHSPHSDPPSPIDLFSTPSPDLSEDQPDVVEVCAVLISWSRVRRALDCFVAMSQSNKVRFLEQRILSRKEEGSSKDAPMAKFLSSAVSSDKYGMARLEEDLRLVAEDISDAKSFTEFLSRTPLPLATKERLIHIAEAVSAQGSSMAPN
ncbi:hypothetical protein CONPUDRAFT_166120 [Coniophora puteana RWD-64-598 SS2]|uniref:Uncharacterized protein n=1 Tax=Coniophora puteana (strain RWD-64-598) TaxID=741705 RepID=A0A5M3MND2_CONPW|nr:uncharacterized protein CONPUDRAFT_166120 [Coniophora puteana RWD-64-598 SS2]EIW80659.1 hypothetical protein CONPUDRAFT_166120 [Coniophora puteana RWD-64-598 SS2]